MVEGVRGGQLGELSTASTPVRGKRIVHKSTGLPLGLGALVQPASPWGLAARNQADGARGHSFVESPNS